MNKVKVTTDIVYSNNTLKDIIICHISDIHFYTNTKVIDLNKIKKEIIKINSDYLLITGDIIDYPDITKNRNKINDLLVFLTDIASEHKVIISLGNHDIIVDNDYKFFNKLNDLYNIYFLNNDKYIDDNICIVGFTLPNNYYYNITKDESVDMLLNYLDEHSLLLDNLPKNLPKVAMVHSPLLLTNELVLNKFKDYDLILSGHTHNGMVPEILNFLFKGNMGIISPRKTLFPSIAKGKIERNINNKKITIIINGGITKLSNQSGKIFSKLNFIYNKSINKIIIRKKRG